MKRFLIAAALCALTAVSGAWTLQWNADANQTPGTTVTACLNGVCVSGVTGNSQSFSESYSPGTVLHGTAQAVPPAGYQCGEPLALCPPSSVAEIAQTIPADQGAPNQSAWTTSTNGGAMAGFDFVSGSFANVLDGAPSNTITINTPVSAQSGDIFLAVISFGASGNPSISSVTTTNTTWSEVIDLSHPGNGQVFKLWKGLVTGSVSSGSTITATISTVVDYQVMQVALFRSDNGSAANPVQLSANTLYYSNPISTDGMSVTVSPTGSNSLTIVEILEIEDYPASTADSSPGTGFTQIAEGDTFSGGVGPYLWAIKTGASTGSQNVTGTYSKSAAYNSTITAVVLEGGASSASSLPIFLNQYSYSALLGR